MRKQIKQNHCADILFAINCRTGFEENKDLSIVLNSVIAGRYYITEYLGSAAFSDVVQARDLHTGIDVCLKIIKNDKDFFDQSLDEIKLLKFVNKHDPSDERHLLRLYDYFYHQVCIFCFVYVITGTMSNTCFSLFLLGIVLSLLIQYRSLVYISF